MRKKNIFKTSEEFMSSWSTRGIFRGIIHTSATMIIIQHFLEVQLIEYNKQLMGQKRCRWQKDRVVIFR
jgi:hypothetical protein